jgi:hypothetical protein
LHYQFAVTICNASSAENCDFCLHHPEATHPVSNGIILVFSRARKVQSAPKRPAIERDRIVNRVRCRNE